MGVCVETLSSTDFSMIIIPPPPRQVTILYCLGIFKAREWAVEITLSSILRWTVAFNLVYFTLKDGLMSSSSLIFFFNMIRSSLLQRKKKKSFPWFDYSDFWGEGGPSTTLVFSPPNHSLFCLVFFWFLFQF